MHLATEELRQLKPTLCNDDVTVNDITYVGLSFNGAWHGNDNMMTSRLTSLEEAVCRLIPDSTDKSICSSLRDNPGVLNGMNNPEEKNNTLITSAEKENRILNRMEVSVDEKDNVIDGPS